MEKSNKSNKASSQKLSGAGDFALRPATSSRLSIHSQSEQQGSSSMNSRRESLRPPTSSTSSQSGTQPDWDQAGANYYGSRATTSSDIDDLNLVPSEFWPRSDSDDDSGGGGSTLKKRSTTSKSGNTARKIKAMLQKFGYAFLPNDAQEKDRNALQHNILLEMLDGKLHQAPVANPRWVLDLGCGPGNWPLDFARRNPNTAVLGVDIDPIKPPYHLPNCRFQTADFTDKWSYEVQFDFIHLRHLGSLPRKDVITTIYENLNPGGWAEFTEWVVSVQSPHNSFRETSFYKWLRYWKLGLRKMGTSVYYPLEYKRLLLEVGFKNVTERKYAVPVNPWPPGRQLQKIGAMMERNIHTILEPMSMPIFTEILEWSPEALRSLLTEVHKELADVRVHAFMTLFTVYAQKPRGESSSASSVRSVEPG